MWDSVSRAVAYGWNVGFIVVQRMSDKVFDLTIAGEEDVFFVSNKVFD